MHQASMWVHTMHQYGLMLVHPQLKDVHQASVCVKAVYISGIKIAQYGLVLCIMHQYGSVLCIHGSMMCIRHHYGTILLNAVQALIYGLMLCIRHHSAAQPVHHESIWLNTAWLITTIQKCEGCDQGSRPQTRPSFCGEEDWQVQPIRPWPCTKKTEYK